MKKKGYLITFEGAEGSGKSTQIRYAVQFLRKKGCPVIFLREPGGTKTSEAIRKVLLDKRFKEMRPETELLLYLAARSQLVREKILPALKKRKIVVLDRYEDSTLAYQGFGGGLSIKTILEMSRFARGSCIPDLTFLLDVETRQGLKRSGLSDRMERKSVAFHRKVRKGFLQLARQNPRRFVVLLPGLSISEIRKRIEARLDAIF